MTTDIAPAWLLTKELVTQLTPAERLVLAYRASVWARPEQRFPPGRWRWLGLNAGRGWGKGHMIAPELNRRVSDGRAVDIALVAPNEARADAVQIQFLIDTAPPWFRPERYQGGLRWPNGVRARVFTPEAPDRARGGNFDFAWCTELVNWAPASRMKTWLTVSEAVRRPNSLAQLVWDSTNSGKIDLISKLEREHYEFPKRHLLRGGTTFDNPLLPREYLQAMCTQYPKGSRRYREEILGESFSESAGALWQHKWIDDNRRAVPTLIAVRVVSWDPSGSSRADADEAGIIVASAGSDTHLYLEQDLTCRAEMGEQAARVLSAALSTKAAGVVIERNHFNDGPRDLLAVLAGQRGVRIERLEPSRPMPEHRPGVLYVRELVSTRAKAVRAEPAAKQAELGLLHHCGYLDALELEMTTWEPDTSDSPNRLDAAVQAVAELAGLGRETRDAAGDIAQAAAAHKKLSEKLTAINRGRRI